MSMETPDFDWAGVDRESVVIAGQPAIAVYLNPVGDIVIRQESQYHPDEDHFIYLRPENAGALSAAILAKSRGLLEPQRLIEDQRPRPLKGKPRETQQSFLEAAE
jgi:hypothetical protein